jgi:hypothetical protein
LQKNVKEIERIRQQAAFSYYFGTQQSLPLAGSKNFRNGLMFIDILVLSGDIWIKQKHILLGD